MPAGRPHTLSQASMLMPIFSGKDHDQEDHDGKNHHADA
jgi:hypothetical protein